MEDVLMRLQKDETLQKLVAAFLEAVKAELPAAAEALQPVFADGLFAAFDPSKMNPQQQQAAGYVVDAIALTVPLPPVTQLPRAPGLHAWAVLMYLQHDFAKRLGFIDRQALKSLLAPLKSSLAARRVQLLEAVDDSPLCPRCDKQGPSTVDECSSCTPR